MPTVRDQRLLDEFHFFEQTNSVYLQISPFVNMQMRINYLGKITIVSKMKPSFPYKYILLMYKTSIVYADCIFFYWGGGGEK